MREEEPDSVGVCDGEERGQESAVSPVHWKDRMDVNGSKCQKYPRVQERLIRVTRGILSYHAASEARHRVNKVFMSRVGRKVTGRQRKIQSGKCGLQEETSLSRNPDLIMSSALQRSVGSGFRIVKTKLTSFSETPLRSNFAVQCSPSIPESLTITSAKRCWSF